MKNKEQKKRKNKKKQYFTNKTNLTQKSKRVKMEGEDKNKRNSIFRLYGF